MYALSELTRDMVGKEIAIHESRKHVAAGAPPIYFGVLRYDGRPTLARIEEADRFYFETRVGGDGFVDELGFVAGDIIEILEQEEVPE